MKIRKNNLTFRYYAILISIFFFLINVILAESLTVDINLEKCPETASFQVKGTIPALQTDSRVLATSISCGCISDFSLKSGTILKASQATPFYAKLNLTGKGGRFDNTVVVTLEKSNYSNIIIRVRGFVEQRINIDKYIDLGDHFIGAAKESKIEFNTDPSESINLNNPHQNLKGDIKSKGKGRWIMSLLPDCSTAGEFFRTLNLNDSQGVKPISVRWSARDPMLKETVALGGIYTVDERIKYSVALSATKNYSLLDLTSNNENITISNVKLLEEANSRVLKFDAKLKVAGVIKENLSCRLKRDEEIVAFSIPIVVFAVNKL